MIDWPSDIAVLIPAYKAADLLPLLLNKMLKFVPRNRIVVVEDGLYDATGQVCTQFGVQRLYHKINRGKGAALATGFEHFASTDIRWVITMDADGQHAPEELKKFIAASREIPSPGICIGARCMKPGVMPPERILSNRLTSALLSCFCGIPIADSQCGYRIYATDFIKRIEIEYNRFEMESEVIMKAAFLGYPVTFIGIQTVYLNGPSHISHLFDTIRWIGAVLRIRQRKRDIITGTSTTHR